MHTTNVSADTVSENNHGLIFAAGAWLTVAGVFSIPLLGNGAHNILLGLPIIMLLFTSQIKLYPGILKQNPTALLATLIFILLAISITWSSAEAKYSFKMLSKYREFLFIPLFMIYFSVPKYRNFAFSALYLALGLSLLASYLIHFDIVNYWDNEHSIKNRIFHGISMAFFAYLSLRLALSGEKVKFVYILIFLITLHNMFFIENGRTGYLLVILLTGLFMIQQWRAKGLLVGLALISAVSILVFFLYDFSDLRIFVGSNNFESQKQWDLTAFQQSDTRMEYYLISCLAFIQNAFIGSGLGSFPTAYAEVHNNIQTYWDPTVNAHNEYLQIGVQTGVIGVILFCALIISFLFKRKNKSESQQQIQTALAVLIGIACLFNSSFMDHGDGMFFMIIIALFTYPLDIFNSQQSNNLSAT